MAERPSTGATVLPTPNFGINQTPLRRVLCRFCRFYRSEAVSENGRVVPLHVQLTNPTLRRVIERLHFPLEIMLVGCVSMSGWTAI